jgi:hypothetical protein
LMLPHYLPFVAFMSFYHLYFKLHNSCIFLTFYEP